MIITVFSVKTGVLYREISNLRVVFFGQLSVVLDWLSSLKGIVLERGVHLRKVDY